MGDNNRPVEILTPSDGLCSKCQTRAHAAEDWLCTSCREEMERAWMGVTSARRHPPPPYPPLTPPSRSSSSSP